MSAQTFYIAFVTAPSIAVARRLASKALAAKLAACANIVPRIESHYWWKGRLERNSESLVLFKTSRKCISQLERLILREHPYDTPEFLAVRIASGNRRYLDWLGASCLG